MWIKEFNGNFEKSMNMNVNFLFKKDKIYIMDNHLSASWCWLNQNDNLNNNNLIHIDRHNDLSFNQGVIDRTILKPQINLKEITFDKYCNIGEKDKLGKNYKTFNWANYILNLKGVYPDYYGNTFFFTYDNGGTNSDFIDTKLNFIDFLNNIEDTINEQKNEKWILNLDLDYFFNTLNGKKIQVFSNELIKEFAYKIKSIYNDLAVITICLSPECCGGWANSIRILKIFSDILDINIDLNK